MAQRTGAQAIIESLIAQGVDTVFGIISTHMMDVYDVLYDHQDSIRFISARHEHAAALMADGYARVTGHPGVCFTSTGPGAANSMGGIGEAYFASSPVLTITSTAEEDLYGRGQGETHATKDQRGMFDSVTQWAHHVTQVDEIPDRIYEAFQRFQTQRPRPIEIEVPVDIQGLSADVEIPQVSRFDSVKGDPALVEKAAAMLLSGKRVAIWAGTGVLRSGATDELIRLAESLGVPVYTTPSGKAAFPDDNHLSMGVFGGFPGWSPNPSEDPSIKFVDSLDTVLVVGSSLPHIHTKAWGLKLPNNLIQIDMDSEMLGATYKPAVGIAGDAKQVLSQLSAAIEGKTGSLAEGFTAALPSLKKQHAEYWRKSMPNQAKTMEAIRGVVDRDAIFMGDVNIATHHGSNYLMPTFAPRTHHVSAWGGLGFAFPAAAGAKAALPDRQVVCITGDGGFQFNIQELGTCIQYGLSPVVMVFNDNAWGVLRNRQRDAYDGRYMASDLVNPDFARLAQSYGANGLSVSSIDEMAQALDTGLKSDVLTVIEVATPNGFENFT